MSGVYVNQQGYRTLCHKKLWLKQNFAGDKATVTLLVPIDNFKCRVRMHGEGRCILEPVSSRVYMIMILA